MSVTGSAAVATTAESIREQASELFFTRGYEATTLRQLAAAVGIQVGSLYNHIDSKEHLLLQVLGGVMDDLLEQQQAALAGEDDVIDRLVAVLECHIRFSASRAREVFIGNAELRSLPAEARQAVIAKRREYEARIRDLIVQAAEQRQVVLLDARLHTFSIVARGTHVASWYRPGGSLSLERIVSLYAKAVLRELSVSDADFRVDNRRSAR
jgi:TetR/AcrR family transcriptional regulator, cholesterol catabolism regulator